MNSVLEIIDTVGGIIILIVIGIIVVFSSSAQEIKLVSQLYLNQAEVIRSITGYTCETNLGNEYPCSEEESKTRGYGSAWVEYER